MNGIRNITQNFINFILKISEKILPKKVLEIERKFLTIEVVLYIFFGVLTTIVNIGVFSILVSLFKNLDENIANIIAIVLAVLFAYFTNKDLVFASQASNFKKKFQEFVKFMIGRAFTMVVEMLGFYFLFNMLNWNKFISKCLITILVIILNFFISKFFAFKTKKDVNKEAENI